MKAVDNFLQVKLTRSTIHDRSTVAQECERKKAQPRNQRRQTLMLNVLFAVKYILPDTNYKTTKMNKIIKWEKVDQKRNSKYVHC